MAAITRFSPEARNCCASASAVGDAALLEGADDLGQEVALFALVQPGVAAPAQLRTFQPIEHEQCALDPSQFLQSQVELVLSAVRRELLQHGGRRNGAGLERRDQADHLVPVLADDVDLDPSSHQRLQIL